MSSLMLAAASIDDRGTLFRLINAGVKATCADYDLRTLLSTVASHSTEKASRSIVTASPSVRTASQSTDARPAVRHSASPRGLGGRQCGGRASNRARRRWYHLHSLLSLLFSFSSLSYSSTSLFAIRLVV
jgi:hypothetical protein